MVSLLAPLLCLSLVLCRVHGESRGPPASTCTSMFPAHGPVAQTSDPPYQITASADSYSPGAVITVTISATGGATFNGFILQARRLDPNLNRDEPVGTFSNPIAGTQLMCSDGALAHNSAASKTTITATWTAPSPDPTGHLEFRATIVGNAKATFWTGVTSDNVTDPTAGALGTTPARAADDEIPAFDLSGCGSAKSCLRSPADCTDNCDQVLTWTPNGDMVDMEFAGTSDGYIAFGLSSDDQMGEDSVTECILNGQFVEVHQSFTEGRSSPGRLSPSSTGLNNTKGYYADGVIRCTFTRAAKEDNDKFYNTDAEQLYTVLVAWGPAASGGFVRKHEDSPLVSDKEADFRVSNQDLALSAEDDLFFKLHACLMVGAWMICASLGLILARYYKPAWPESTLCSNKVWFQLHRLLMILTFLLTIAGFVLIFLDVEDLTDEASYDPKYLRAHPIVGFVVTGLVIVNPIMAMFRCHPEEPNRYIYNWAHWLVGTTAHVAGVVNIFLGLGFDRSDRITPDWLKYVWLAYVGVHILTQVILEIKKCRTESAVSVRQQEIEMTNVHGKPMIDSQGGDPQNLRFQYVVLVIYMIAVLGLGGVTIAYIAIGEE